MLPAARPSPKFQRQVTDNPALLSLPFSVPGLLLFPCVGAYNSLPAAKILHNPALFFPPIHESDKRQPPRPPSHCTLKPSYHLTALLPMAKVGMILAKQTEDYEANSCLAGLHARSSSHNSLSWCPSFLSQLAPEF